MPADSNTHKLPSSALRRFAWGFLAYSIAVILWGTIVRATGSGAGCGDHWPLCNGTVMQQSPTMETLIEFFHRITSGISLIGVLLLLVWTWRTTEHGHLARRSAVASFLLMLVEAILGALLVKLGLTAQSQSPLRAPFLAMHLTNTLLLIAALALTAHLLLWMLARALQHGNRGKIWNNRPLTLFIFGLLLAEYMLGTLNVVLLAPVWMQVVHLLAADVLWVALVVLTARLTLMPRTLN